MSSDEIVRVAIKRAIKALHKRHLLEEGAHTPAIDALTRPFASQGLEWKDKAEKLELELQQCYRAQSRLSEQLVVEVAECRSSKAILQEKESVIINLQNEFTQAREENSVLRESLGQKREALDLTMTENQALKAQFEDVMQKLKEAQMENKNLIDRWMLEKMKDAEKLNERHTGSTKYKRENYGNLCELQDEEAIETNNFREDHSEVNALYDEMMQQLKVSGIGQLARQQVDGVVRQREAGYEDADFAASAVPSLCKHVIHAHEGGCGSVMFEHNSSRLITGGQDRTVKVWDATTGILSVTLRGSIGSILDIAVTHDNGFVIGASSSNNLCVWESSSGRARHTLTGHTDKVCSVDATRHSACNIISAAYDHTIMVWDLQKGSDGLTICSGHVDGNLRLWDGPSGKLMGEVAAHSQAITSVSLSRAGNIVLTSGRDNVHNLFDARTLEVCGTFRDGGSRVASNWSRSCMSGDENFVASGSADGSISIWSRSKSEKVSVLGDGHASPVLSCIWNGLG